ncbi:MAG: hypothetical protein JNM93_13525 [Bacteriovoracaceae bacterium]|nr:hypothetical protein [Bacteriovoracaceae bacterium]
MVERRIYTLISFFLAFAMAAPLFANTHYYDTLYLGEKNPENFSGRTFPSVHQNEYLGSFEDFETQYYADYFDRFIVKDLTMLKAFFQTSVPMGMNCPNSVLDRHVDYIQYSYRLLNLSYLYEAFSDYHQLSKLHASMEDCQLNYQELLNKCQPKTSEMKNFIQHALVFLSKYNDFRLTSTSIPATQNALSQLLTSSKASVLQSRLQSWCTKKNCKSEQVVSEFNKICYADKKLFQKICSEEDDLYGSANNILAFDLLSRSNVINVFNQEGLALGCLRRYSQLKKNSEEPADFLPGLYAQIRQNLTTQYGNRFLQGMLFIPGALREFTEKGLTEIFEPKIHEVIEVTKIEPNKELGDEAKIEVKAKPKEEVPKEVVIEKPTEKTEKAFKVAVDILANEGVQQVDLEMLKFKYDYFFTPETIQKLDNALKKYSSHSMLSNMKKKDKLGEKKAPVPLSFIKYMIDTENHQSLFNMTLILSDKFYIFNNFEDEVSKVYLIQLKNDISTNYAWQISLLKN